MAMKYLIAILLAAFSVSTGADVYRWVDESGQVQFSDRPPESGAERVDLPPTSTYTPRQLPQTLLKPKPTEAGGEKGQLAYERIAIVKPEQDATIRDNTGRVEIQVDLKPGLRPGHRLALYMDGDSVFDRLNTTAVALTNVVRGSHELRVRVLDANGAEVIASEPTIFHLHKASVLIPKPGPTPTPLPAPAG